METAKLREILLSLPKLARKVILFRNNTGMGWTGEVTRYADGSILIRKPRPLHAGLIKGSSDLIGWTEVEITPEMVGKRVAMFTAIEAKAEKGKATAEQLQFIARVNEAGGIAGIARSPEDVSTIVNAKP